MDKSVGKVLPKEIYQRLKNLEKKVKFSNIEKGVEMDKEKFKMLLKEYKEFKLNNTRHFRFNSAANSTNFGKFKSSSSLIALSPLSISVLKTSTIKPDRIHT